MVGTVWPHNVFAPDVLALFGWLAVVLIGGGFIAEWTAQHSKLVAWIVGILSAALATMLVLYWPYSYWSWCLC